MMNACGIGQGGVEVLVGNDASDLRGGACVSVVALRSEMIPTVSVGE